MAAQHLVIGLGGTGGSAIAALRRTIHERYGSASGAPLALGYLYIDISETDTEQANSAFPAPLNEQVWRTGGASVQLDPAQILRLQAPPVEQILANGPAYPHIANWFGPPEKWRLILDRFPGPLVAGAQMRRYGRYFFANRRTEIANAILGQIAAVQNRLRGMGAAVDDTVHIHIVCGLAGGTGSGGVVETLCIAREVRSQFQTAQTKIAVYAALPEQDRTPWDQGNYHANGYAAVQELNGVLVHAFTPTRPDGSGEPYANPRPNSVVLVTNRSAAGSVISQSEGIPSLLADTLFQCIVGSGDAVIGGDPIHGANNVGWLRYLTCENQEQADERDEPPVAGTPGQRSRRFLTFGIKRIRVPREEVRETLTDRYKIQVMRQLIYNNWQEGIGFGETPRNLNFAEAATNGQLNARFGMTLNQLTLQERFLENDGNWGSLGTEFSNVLTKLAGDVAEEGGDSLRWPARLDELARKRFDEQFRNQGVVRYYQSQANNNQERVAEILKRIDEYYFDRWQNGDLSISDITSYILQHREAFQEMRRSIDRSNAALERDVNNFGEALSRKVKEYPALLGAIFRKKRLQDLASAHAQLLAAKARIIANNYARDLISAVVTAVDGYKDQLGQVEATLKRVLDEAARKADNRLGEQGDLDRGHVVSYIDMQAVRRTTNLLITDRQGQANQASAVRTDIAVKLGDGQRRFTAILSKIGEPQLAELIDHRTRVSVDEQHGALDQSQQVIRGSILQKLYDEKGGNVEGLQAEVAAWARAASQYVQFNQEEQAQIDPYARNALSSCMVVFVPKADGLPEPVQQFRQRLVEIIMGAIPNNFDERRIADTDNQDGELVFLSLTNTFPARYSETLKMSSWPRLRALINRDPNKVLELYTEGDGSQMPHLFRLSPEEVRAQALPHYLLARATGIARDWTDPETGTKSVQIDKPGSSMGEMVEVSDDPETDARNIRESAFRALRTQVQTWLEANRHETVRKQIADSLDNRVRERLASHYNGNPHAAGFKAEIEIATKAKELLGRLPA